MVFTAHIAQLAPLLFFIMQALDELEPLKQLAGGDAAHRNGMGEQVVDSGDGELSFLIFDEEMDKECGSGCDGIMHCGSTAGMSGNKARNFDAAVTRLRKLYFGYARRPPVYIYIHFARWFGVLRVIFNGVY